MSDQPTTHRLQTPGSNLAIRPPCGEWCPLLGLSSVGHGLPFCQASKGHDPPHRLEVTLARPAYRFTVEWTGP